MKLLLKKEDFIDTLYNSCSGCALWQAVMREFNFKPELEISVGPFSVNTNKPQRHELFTINQEDGDSICNHYRPDSRKEDFIIELIPTKYFIEHKDGLSKINT